MTKVLVLFATDYGNTKKMAETVAAGARSVNHCTVTLKLAEEATEQDLIDTDALILGSPVHMGSPDWRVKKFIDKVCSKLWMQDKLIGKIGGVFVTGGGFGSAGGGCELSMLAMITNLAELGMVLAPLPKNTPGYAHGGLQWGPYARSAGINGDPVGVSEDSLEAAFHHGANIARLAESLKGAHPFVSAASAKV